MQQLIDFITTRPHLNISSLAEGASINTQLLHDVLKGTKPLPEKHIPALCRELSRYGLEIDGWRVTYFEEDHTFLLKKQAGEEIEVIETENSFVYKVPFWRSINDSFDLIEFFKKD